MERFFHKYTQYIAASLLVVALLVGAKQVLAKEGSDATSSAGFEFSQGHKPPTSDFRSPRPPGDDAETRDGSPSGKFNGEGAHLPGFIKLHLEGNKLKACESIEKVLTNRSSHLVDLVSKMEKVFTSIALGVENYYINKVVPTGVTLPNYDALVADITTKQNALTPLVTAAQTDAANFSCTGDNPGALMTQYRTDMKGVLTGLQEYRKSIRNLIVAVRGLLGNSEGESPSASPSASPLVLPSASVIPSSTP